MGIDNSLLVLTAAAAFAVSLIATPILARYARARGILDHPRAYKAHPTPIPLLGGVAIAAGTLCGVVAALLLEPRTRSPGLGALGLGVVIILVGGLLDDVRGLSPRNKFAWQFCATVAAGLCLPLLGVRLQLFLEWPIVPVVLLTALWIVAVTNAYNFLDNMDGLCAGLGAIAAAALAVVNLRSGELGVAVTAAALSGGCLAFLPFNWPRAHIFLGDAGSMLVGFLLASLSVMGVYTRGASVPVFAVLTPLFVVAVPILDLVLVAGLRVRAGQPPWLGDRRHMNHRLVRRGMRPVAAVATLWAAAGASGLAAILLPTVGATEAPLLFALLACALAALAAAAGTEGLP